MQQIDVKLIYEVLANLYLGMRRRRNAELAKEIDIERGGHTVTEGV